jgi:hypothetical protein
MLAVLVTALSLSRACIVLFLGVAGGGAASVARMRHDACMMQRAVLLGATCPRI